MLQLGQVRDAIRRAEHEQRQAAEREPRERPRAADEARMRQRRRSETDALAGDPEDDPAGPGRAADGMRWWHIEPAAQGPNGHPAYLHRGDCARYNAHGRPGWTRDEARAALADQTNGVPTVLPCPTCRPDTGLA